MNVLSLFDGMGCGWIALRELGIKVDRGYSSEVDKYAIAQVKLNFPEVIHLGSVTDIDVSKLEHIDLLIGGSPCQSFSFAGKRIGMSTKGNEEIYTLERYMELKGNGFQFEGQSYLFWEYMRILTDIRKYNPDVLFLLENVEMEKKWESVLSEAIGLRGVHINSALVSAQNRRRIYWTNIRVGHEGLFGYPYSDIPQPADRGVLLKDILEKEVCRKYFLSRKMVDWLNIHKEKRNVEIRLLDGDDKSHCLTASGKVKGNLSTDYICAAMRGRESACLTPRRTEYGKQIRKKYEAGEVSEQRKNIQQLEPRTDSKTNCLTTVQKDNLIVVSGTVRGFGGIHFREIKSGKSCTLMARARNDGSSQPCVRINTEIRRLTPTECARLQTVPEWYIWNCSDTQQYKMLGNGWTVEVIKHILSFIKIKES
nr:MAG TPA: Cytosine specific methyltransferase [Caudoviricetes sp.]